MTGHKLFFALRPDAATADRIAQAVTAAHEARGLAPRLRPARIFHITLHYFGYFQAEPDAQLIAAASSAAAEVVRPAFDLQFDRFASWGRPGATRHPFVLTGGQGLEAVRDLRDALVERLAAHGVARPAHDYEPHLTLRYDKRPATAWPVELPGWIASEFVLVQSPQGLTRHDVLRRWPLQG
ncbi:2'-5' RNA ligase family protein [Roseateles cellulosilyticus]|uniref:2'-5' RNA ligase family protein n=1 Tax=Pelomonas cellulosilytica TaxID=2906762 RepID=A0ABS8XL44_9BURK|nr:2'-5' RNA ligase family protein [Pelomonas sp. P8]MCE4553541.1 2'-5' RNA ligase family protein [Pelomonas sp. P8]